MKNANQKSLVDLLRFLMPLSTVLLSLFLSGCSLFFGNIRPVEEKSTAYGIEDLSRSSTEWTRMDSSKESPEAPQSGIADSAFQSKKTASIISINSACKSYENNRKESLVALTRELLLGISEITTFEEKNLFLDKNPALQTTVQGNINQEKMMLQTVVVQKGKCIYDLMYVSRPEKFILNQSDFSRFVSSLRLK